MPRLRKVPIVSWRLVIESDQLTAMRGAAGKEPLVRWCIAALRLGCHSPRELPRVYRDMRKPARSVFLEIPAALAAEVDRTYAHVGITRSDFVRACFRAAIERAA